MFFKVNIQNYTNFVFFTTSKNSTVKKRVVTRFASISIAYMLFKNV